MEQPIDAALESIVAGDWETENRAGVEHYKTGQHRAARVPESAAADEVYVLAYAPIDGHQIIALPVARLEEDGIVTWEPAPHAVSTGSVRGTHIEALPADFELSEAMLAALNAARG